MSSHKIHLVFEIRSNFELNLSLTCSAALNFNLATQRQGACPFLINTADLLLIYKYANGFFDQIWKCLVTITVQTTAVPPLFTTVPPHLSIRDHDNLTIKKKNVTDRYCIWKIQQNPKISVTVWCPVFSM